MAGAPSSAGMPTDDSTLISAVMEGPVGAVLSILR